MEGHLRSKDDSGGCLALIVVVLMFWTGVALLWWAWVAR